MRHGIHNLKHILLVFSEVILRRRLKVIDRDLKFLEMINDEYNTGFGGLTGQPLLPVLNGSDSEIENFKIMVF